ncbi:MAG TPA: XRE family transcriptional regulator [Rhizomicrobium sp.]|jgi:Zn-dependent peptidase ImmA (M78 family)/transcriptional regulator with XRE-family HTH domain
MPFNHKLLLLARQYRERSQASVAAGAKLTQPHYSRIESGLLPDGPSDENAVRIAKTLSFPVSFFYQPDGMASLPLSMHPMHRKRESVGERTLKRLHAELNIRLMHIRRLLAATETEQELPLPRFDVDDAGGPREIARKVRSAWMIPPGPIDNLVHYAERAGVLVVVCDLGEKIDGVTMQERDLPPCIFLNRTVTADRLRFSLAHEIGHIIMHRIPTDTMEDEANTFAGELLTPSKELYRYFIGRKITLESLARAKAFWRVSMQSVLYQAKEIGVIGHYPADRLWRRISQLGWRTREPADTDFEPEQADLFPALLNLHTNDLEYKPEEVAGLFHIEINELRDLYGIQPSGARSHLHVIK